MQHRDLDLKYNTSWSQLYPTDMGRHVAVLMETPRRRYHNITHVQRLYRHAQRLNVPYDINLDCAILWHDAVYDSEPDKEYRSVDAMKAAAKSHPEWFDRVDISAAAAMIVNTIGHTYVPDVNPWMIRLDTIELADPDMRYENFWLLLGEARDLYGVDNTMAAQGTIDFLSAHLAPSLASNTVKDLEFSDGWQAALEGCNDTMHMARVIVDLYRRGRDD